MGPLKGTLSGVPDKCSPVVLIIPGSGPTDRDGNSVLGIKAAPYKLLAEGLAAKGIVSARIDKRGMFASAAAVPDPDAVTVADYVDDIHNWINTLRRRTGTNAVWLLGHSEGGLVALSALTRASEHIAGLLLVACPGRPAGEVLMSQLRANPANAPLLDAAAKAIAALSSGQLIDARAVPPALEALFRPAVQSFLISLFALDPAQLIKQVNKPVLILQGKRDLQVGIADAKRLHQFAPASTLLLIPDTNHVLKRVAVDEPSINLAAYADANLPLAPGVIEAIALFVRSNSGQTPHQIK
ncbi:alpha/beta hydrolase [Sodalis sp. RH23]